MSVLWCPIRPKIYVCSFCFNLFPGSAGRAKPLNPRPPNGLAREGWSTDNTRPNTFPKIEQTTVGGNPKCIETTQQYRLGDNWKCVKVPLMTQVHWYFDCVCFLFAPSVQKKVAQNKGARTYLSSSAVRWWRQNDSGNSFLALAFSKTCVCMCVCGGPFVADTRSLCFQSVAFSSTCAPSHWIVKAYWSHTFIGRWSVFFHMLWPCKGF